MRQAFVSKPNALHSDQLRLWEELKQLLAERTIQPRTIGETDFPNVAPCAAVRELMTACHGAIILGFEQTIISEGLAKAGTAQEYPLRNVAQPTPWNQLEAGMAFALQLPLLIIREPTISGGIFDAGSTDRFIHQASLEGGWIRSPAFLQPFNRWTEEMVVHELR